MSKLSVPRGGPLAVKVSSRYQISLPSIARRQLDINAGDLLLVDVQDGVLVLMPEPLDYVEQMAGLHQDLWDHVDTDQYLREERAAWTTSEKD